MEEASERLGRNLTLTEEEERGVVLKDDTWLGNQRDSGFYLVGRLLARRTAKFDFMRETLMTVMNPVKGMDIKCISDNTFLFIFRHALDKSRAMEGCPWSFEKNILILSEVGDDENPLSVDLSWCAFYVHIHDLPIRKMTRDIAESVGNRMGRFIDMEHMDDYRYWSPTLRIRVQLNVLKPLLRYMKIRSEEGGELTVSFTYERLPNFCYLCGKLGHLSKDCERRYEHGFQDPGELILYGPWLRAAPANRRPPMAGSSKFGSNNKGKESDYFAPRYPHQNHSSTANIFNPTPTRNQIPYPTIESLIRPEIKRMHGRTIFLTIWKIS